MSKVYNANIELLKLVTAGSVDDGKSTLIGRLLYDAEAIYQDQIDALKAIRNEEDPEAIDFSLLTDGLSAEREQKITIDVAYKYFSTAKRKFIIADVPGHEQYTRNMVTGASNADLLIVLVDAQKGLKLQSKRHLFLATLLGVQHILVAVNKMDLANYSEAVFENIRAEVAQFAAKLNIRDIRFIPLSSLRGDMVVKRGDNMPWYGGETLLGFLESLYITSDRNLIDFRLPVQLVMRPNASFRGYAGQIVSGTIAPGEEIIVLPSGRKSSIKDITVGEQKVTSAFSPQSVVVTLNDEVDVSRGDMIVRRNNLPEVKNECEAMIFWMSEEDLELNRPYLLKHTTRTVKCQITDLRYKINIETLHREPADRLLSNDVGRTRLKTLEPIMFDSYERHKGTGSFIIIDEFTNNTVGAGIILGATKEVPLEEAV